MLTTVERRPPPKHAEQFFAVVWLGLEPGRSQRRYRVALGEHHEIAKAYPSVYTANFVSIHRALSHLRENARRAGITLPEKLTIARGEPGFKQWRADIDAYREAAGARLAKAKLTPA